MEKNALADVESVDRHSSVPKELQDASVSRSDQRLRELGYKSEFRRDMSLFGVLGISFCAIGILTGMSSAFQTGLFSGGPLGLFWGWNVSPHDSLATLDHVEELIVVSEDLQSLHAAYCAIVGRDLQRIVSKCPTFALHFLITM